jgi:hypothetical protein
MMVASTEATSIAPSRASEITALEVRKQVLTQALKIMNNQADEERLSQLHLQWLAAGREISEKLFTVVPEPTEDGHGQEGTSNNGSYYQDPPKVNPRMDEDEVQVADTSADEPKVKKDWNVGSMLDMFGVDPALFGWNEELEDWQD